MRQPRSPSRPIASRLAAILAASLLVVSWPAETLLATPGEPIRIGGPTSGIEGVPFTWNTTAPIQYRVDPGPMAKNPIGTILVDNANGISRVVTAFGDWAGVTTAALSFANA